MVRWLTLHTAHTFVLSQINMIYKRLYRLNINFFITVSLSLSAGYLLFPNTATTCTAYVTIIDNRILALGQPWNKVVTRLYSQAISFHSGSQTRIPHTLAYISWRSSLYGRPCYCVGFLRVHVLLFSALPFIRRPIESRCVSTASSHCTCSTTQAYPLRYVYEGKRLARDNYVNDMSAIGNRSAFIGDQYREPVGE